ncbi:hypothetical protein R1sor_024410 [Riccia sorocarpa]|uniref:Uncharacterized protein n=1 Tax=Riccia sorocarpa TaxID=122646 RepID=A0ABD3GWH7_9MARC
MARSFKGCLASASTGLLSILNIIIVLAAIATIVIEVYLERPPSRIGWLFLAVSIVTVISGLFGIRATKSVGCFSWHLIALLFSLGGLISAGLVIFIKVGSVQRRMDSTRNPSDTKRLLKLMGAIFFISGCVQAVILVLAIIASCCEFVDYYEDLEMSNRENLNQMQAESEKRAAKKADTNASKLADKMREKYGQHAHGEFATGKRSTVDVYLVEVTVAGNVYQNGRSIHFQVRFKRYELFKSSAFARESGVGETLCDNFPAKVLADGEQMLYRV